MNCIEARNLKTYNQHKSRYDIARSRTGVIVRVDINRCNSETPTAHPDALEDRK